MSSGNGVIADTDVVLDNLPESVISSMEVRDRWFTEAANGGGGEFYIVDDLRRWLPGQTLRVAFLGGEPVLHKEIAETAQQITEACNLGLDFGFDSTAGQFRTWSPSDTDYAAEIRVSFDQQGYFSLVGSDSISLLIGMPGGAVGGRPNQRSLNLQGFDVQKPSNWQGIVRHEFLHALAFHHEHQSPLSGCEQEFRWEDDPGYQPTRDAQGRHITDTNGRKPGIYTYLAGYPNFWSQAKVDHNLRPLRGSDIRVGPFDPSSVMLYRFPALFYRRSPSPCAPVGDGINLSQGDKNGLLTLYPHDQEHATAIFERSKTAFESFMKAGELKAELRADIQAQVDILNQR